MIYERVKDLRTEARKDRNAELVGVFTYIQGELERGEKNPSNEKSLKVLKKVLAVFEETGDTLGVDITKGLLEDYTPKQLSPEKIKEIIQNSSRFGSTEMLSIGDVQKMFKDFYPGQYSGGDVTRIYKEVANGE